MLEGTGGYRRFLEDWKIISNLHQFGSTSTNFIRRFVLTQGFLMIVSSSASSSLSSLSSAWNSCRQSLFLSPMKLDILSSVLFTESLVGGKLGPFLRREYDHWCWKLRWVGSPCISSLNAFFFILLDIDRRFWYGDLAVLRGQAKQNLSYVCWEKWRWCENVVDFGWCQPFDTGNLAWDHCVSLTVRLKMWVRTTPS